MNWIKVGTKFINLDNFLTIEDCLNEDSRYPTAGHVVLSNNIESSLDAPEIWISDDSKYAPVDAGTALIAWLSVPAHMAGVIAADDRDVMAWWQRQQAAAVAKSELVSAKAKFAPGTVYHCKRDGVIYQVISVFELDGDIRVYGQVVGGGEHDRDWELVEGCEIVDGLPAAN